MAIKNMKPTTPGQRGMSKLRNDEITTNSFNMLNEFNDLLK